MYWSRNSRHHPNNGHLVARGIAAVHPDAGRRRLVAGDTVNCRVAEHTTDYTLPVGSSILLAGRTAAVLRKMADRTGSLAVGPVEAAGNFVVVLVAGRRMVCRYGTAGRSPCYVVGLAEEHKIVGYYVGLTRMGCMKASMRGGGRTTMATDMWLGVLGRCKCRWSPGWSTRSSDLAVIDCQTWPK
jgi:hypothetical protein